MIDKLEKLFLPHEKNNQKPKLLHLSSLTILISLIGIFQLTLAVITKVAPGVLGETANISPTYLVELTNQKRSEQGLAPLNVDSLLTEAARAKAADMFSQDYWAHNSPTGRKPWWFFNNVGYDYVYAGENLARDFMEGDSIVDAWMKSPTHRDNIINENYDDIGIAVVDGVLDGKQTTLVVQMFGTKTGSMQDMAAVEDDKSILKQEVMAKEKDTRPQENINNPEQYLEEIEPGKTETTISKFKLTKRFSIFLILFVLVALVIDITYVSQKKTVRISGKSLVHLIFLVIILLTIWLSTRGQIL